MDSYEITNYLANELFMQQVDGYECYKNIHLKSGYWKLYFICAITIPYKVHNMIVYKYWYRRSQNAIWCVFKWFVFDTKFLCLIWIKNRAISDWHVGVKIKYSTSNLRPISGCIRTIEFNKNEMNNQTKQTPKQNKT